MRSAPSYLSLTDKATFEQQEEHGFLVGGEKYAIIDSELGRMLQGTRHGKNAVAALSERAIIAARDETSLRNIDNGVEDMPADLAAKGF